jgi:metal-responsive CopG/Arc/MetJ family transcriptional regulator
VRESSKQTRKVTISLPQHLVEYADCRAKERGVSRSQLVAELIEESAARGRDVLAAEGYCFYAQEAEEFACTCLAASSEVICRCS